MADIIKGEINDQEKALLAEKRTFYESLAGDEATIDEINGLIQEAEPMEKWKEVAKNARLEIETLPPDILERIFQRAAPYIKNLPAAHGRGHFLRDSINATLLLQDPAMSSYPPEEVMAGILGALYHDIGNSVVNRYEEMNRFAAHGEVGSHLFGSIAKGVLPPNLLKMTQLSIAGHTHYRTDTPVLRDATTGEPIIIPKDSVALDKDENEITSATYKGEIQIKNTTTGKIQKRNVVRKVRKAHDAVITDGAKTGLWISRWADRLDTRGVSHIIRHTLTKASPTRDFDGKEFNQIDPDEIADFKREFEAKDNAETKNIPWHLLLLANSDTATGDNNGKGIYNQYDTDYMTQNLFGPENNVVKEFVENINNAPTSMGHMSQDGREAILRDGMAKYEALCRLLEPARDLEGQLGKLREKFGKLGEPAYAWALVFKQLYEKMYPEAETRRADKLKQIKPLNFGDNTASQRVNTILGTHLYDIARAAEGHFKPGNMTAS